MVALVILFRRALRVLKSVAHINFILLLEMRKLGFEVKQEDDEIIVGRKN